MVRAGLVRQIGTGLWSWLPAGWRVHQKVVQIIREEIDAIGGQEMLMPVLQPADGWRRPGRYEIDELFKLKDRKGADLVLAMTHEECVTTHVAQVVRSYRDLPLILYHFQVKERDEPRPRAGVLRTREFIMKDAYTFDRDEDGPQGRLRRVRRRLRPDLRAHRAGVVQRRVRRRDDGRLGRARVHGAVRGGRERGRARARLRRQRRGRERRRAARRPAPAAAGAGVRSTRPARRRSTPSRGCWRPRGRAAEGAADRGRRRPRHRSWSSSAATIASTRSSSRTRSARMPPAQRRGDRRAARPARLHRPGRRRHAGAARRRRRGAGGYVAGANAATRT